MRKCIVVTGITPAWTRLFSFNSTPCHILEHKGGNDVSVCVNCPEMDSTLRRFTAVELLALEQHEKCLIRTIKSYIQNS